MKTAVAGAIIFLLTISVVYGIVALDYGDRISKADSAIENKSEELITIWKTPPQKTPPSTEPPPEETVETNSEYCFKCHGENQVSSFHFPDKIKILDEKRGKPVRVCTTCHGSPVMPVHFKAIQRKVVNCETCHLIGGGGFSVPVKKEGDMLICELCHARGNYISIHIYGEILKEAEIDEKWIRQRGGGECIQCHNEALYDGKSILKVHEENASGAESPGVFKQVEHLPEMSQQGMIAPKNISDSWTATLEPTTVIELG